MPRAKASPPAGVPDRSTPTTRASAPASPGLPPARRRLPTHTKRSRAHPSKRKGRTKVETVEALVQAVQQVEEQGATPSEAAIAFGLDASGNSVKVAVKTARRMFVDKVGFYLQAHEHATRRAAEQGDAKPAQWALERMAEGGERVFDAPDAGQAMKPAAVRIGIRIGGIPDMASQPVEATAVTAVELPALQADNGEGTRGVPAELMP